MDDGGGFPSINYVPIAHSEGPGILEGLSALMQMHKSLVDEGASNAYLKQHPFQGADNMGALEAALKVLGGQNTQSDSTMRQAEGAADTSNAASRATEVTNEEAYQKILGSNDTTKTANEAAYDKILGDNDTLKTKQEGVFQQGQLTDAAAKTAAMVKDTNTRVNEEATAHADTDKTIQAGHLQTLLEHYQSRQESGIPLTPQEQQSYEQVQAAALRAAGIDSTQQGAPAPTVNPNRVPSPNDNPPSSRGVLGALGGLPPGQGGGVADTGVGGGQGGVLQDANLLPKLPDGSSYSLPPVQAAGTGGDYQTKEALQQDQLTNAAEALMNTLRYERVHGVPNSSKGQPESVMSRLAPQTRQQLLQFIQQHYPDMFQRYGHALGVR